MDTDELPHERSFGFGDLQIGDWVFFSGEAPELVVTVHPDEVIAVQPPGGEREGEQKDTAATRRRDDLTARRLLGTLRILPLESSLGPQFAPSRLLDGEHWLLVTDLDGTNPRQCVYEWVRIVRNGEVLFDTFRPKPTE